MGLMGLALCMIRSNTLAVILKAILTSLACKNPRHAAEIALVL